MIGKNKVRLVVDEDENIVKQIDAIAEAEGIARSDVLRRAIRRLLFSLPSVIDIDRLSNDETEQVAA